MMKYSFFKIFSVLIIAACALYFYCSNSNMAGGGSGTETVSGILVDTTGDPVKGAIVNIAAFSRALSSDTFTDTTDKDGIYLVENIKAGTYSLSGYLPDSSLVILIDNFLYEDDSEPLSLGTDTMYAPGAISGRVLLCSKSAPGVKMYIPGTSYIAHSDEDGYFCICPIIPGIYRIYYEYDKYLTDIKYAVRVNPGCTTYIETKNLEFDPDEPPPPPDSIYSSYDTLTGTVILSWNPVIISDLDKYRIYLVKGNNDPEKLGDTKDSVFYDTVFSDVLDTADYKRTYQIKSIDNQNNLSEVYSHKVTVNAVSPTNVRTTFKWILIPNEDDTIVNGEKVKLAVSYSNKSRKNRVIIWTIGQAADTVKIDSIDAKKGKDTLTHTFQDSGVYTVYAGTVDDAGCSWSDSCRVSIYDSTVLFPPDTWLDCPEMLHKRRYHNSVIADGKMYVFGGEQDILIGDEFVPINIDKCEFFNLQDSTWNLCEPILYPRSYAGAVTVNDKIYLIGGISDSGYSKYIEVYNPEDDTWENKFEMPFDIFGHAVCVKDETIYVSGGAVKNRDLITSSKKIYTINPESGEWEMLGEMDEARVYHQMVFLSEKLYIFGGMSDMTTGEAVSSAEVYNLDDYSFKKIQNMKSPRMYFGAAALKGKIYVSGGLISYMSGEIIGDMEAYNPENDTWENRKPIPEKRHCFSVSVYKNRMFITGGSDRWDPLGQLNTVLKYYP